MQQIDVNSFGYHPTGSTSLGKDPFLETIHPYLQLAYVITGIALVALGIAGTISLPIAGIVAAGLVIASGSTALYNYVEICQTAGIIVSSDDLKASLSGTSSQCEALPTEHSADTEQWRKKLIASAKENILISGNYCGGNAFDELLDDIAARMKEQPKLKAVIV